MTPAHSRNRFMRAFTLLELSVVMALIGFIAAGALVTLTASIQSSQFNATVTKMDAIDKAMLNYRVAFNRIPCPADPTRGPSDPYYGWEANSAPGSAIAVGSGFCTGGTPAAQYTGASTAGSGGTVAEGSVPVRALNLPDSYLYDAWGNRFRYDVDITMTATNAFTTYALSNNTCGHGNITIYDSTLAPNRSTSAIYALISHGQNGHGAVVDTNVPLNSQSTNSAEQINCHCNNNGTFQAYPNWTPSGVSPAITTPTFVQMAPAGSTTLTNSFDDIVTYKERWQMQAPGGDTLSSNTCPYVVVTNCNSGTDNAYHMYYWQAGRLKLLPDPAIQPAAADCGVGTAGAFTYDNRYFVGFPSITSSSYVHGSQYAMTLYNASGAGLSWLEDIDNTKNYPYDQFTLSRKNYSILLNIGYETPGLKEWVVNAYPVSTTPTYTVNNFMNIFVYAPNGNIYGPGSGFQNPAYFYIANPSGLTATKTYDISSVENTSSSSTGTITGVDVHPSGNYVALATVYQTTSALNGDGSSTTVPLSVGPAVMKNPEGNYTWLSNGLQQPGDGIGGVQWSPDGNYLAYVLGNHGGVGVYSFISETLTALPVQPDGCSTNIQSISWSSDSQYLAVASGWSGQSVLCFYQRTGIGASAVFNKITTTGDALPPNPVAAAFTH